MVRNAAETSASCARRGGHDMKTPNPRGTVIPRYWSDPSRFAADRSAPAHWSWKPPRRPRATKKRLLELI